MMGKPPKPAGRPRTGARVAAVQALFQSEQSGETAETVAQQFIRHRIGAGDGDDTFEDGRVPLAHIPLFEAILKAAVEISEGTYAGALDLNPVYAVSGANAAEILPQLAP